MDDDGTIHVKPGLAYTIMAWLVATTIGASSAYWQIKSQSDDNKAQLTHLGTNLERNHDQTFSRLRALEANDVRNTVLFSSMSGTLGDLKASQAENNRLLRELLGRVGSAAQK